MADQNINLKIPGEHKPLAFEAIQAMTDVPIKIECHDLFDKGSGHHYVNIAPKGGGETNKEFAERWAYTWVRAAIILYKLAEDTDRREGEIVALDPVTENVPEDIIVSQ